MAENMLSGVGGGAYQDVKTVVTTTGGKIVDVKNLKENYKKLMKEAEELWKLSYDIQKEASRVRIKPATRDWITKINMLKTKVNELETEYNEGKRKRWRLDRFWSNANFSEDLGKKRQQVRSLLEEGKLQMGVLEDELPNSVWTKNGPEIEENSSPGEVVRDVLNHLKDEKVRRIGIWGVVGTGKTTIMEHLNDNEKIHSMFEIVILETVSKERSIEKLQEAIMQRLELDGERSANIQRNAQIISRGLNKKKCLILVDEVWHTIDLHKVMGIHNNHNHSKVVLASIYHGICTNMETDVQIEVKPLSPADAWNMFRKKVGDVISNCLIEPTTRLVVQECHGLPLLIDRVAKTFKKKQRDFTLWDDGLESLQRWDSDRVEGIEEVLERLQVCYEDLKDEEKDCFLYGALYPEESMIYVDYLLECWRAEDFIGHAEEFRKARIRGHAILHELMGVSFLEKTEKRKYVKMNKVLRSLALKISLQKDYKYLAKPREGLQEFPDPEECSQASKISLMDNRLQTLPETLDCGNLSTLFLQRNKDLSVIPQLFFQSMCSLRVLDLQGTGIAFLPSSISMLVFLRGLYLNSCNRLDWLPSEIEALQQLEVLDIRGTRLNLRQIQSLIWLKCLRISLSNCCIERTEVSDIQRIGINFNPFQIPILLKQLAVSLYSFAMGNHTQEQSGIISRFVSLEELSTDVESSQQLWETGAEDAIEEIAKLNQLTSLRLYFPRVDHLRLFVTKSQVWNSRFTFQFSAGYEDSTHSQIFESLHSPRYNPLKMVNGEGTDPVISEVLGKTHAFGLKNHRGVSSLSDFDIEKMNHMLVCLLEGCNKVETMISGGGTMTRVLENLEILHVNNMLRLASIWNGFVPDGSLGQLTTLTLIKCPELKKVFSNGMIQQLPQLQHLRVEECHQMEEIIMEPENGGLEANPLPRLMTLVLLDLPTLKNIWIDDSLNWPSLRKIKISTCRELKKLPFNMLNATRLRSIEGQNSWWNALEWADDGATRQRLEPLCILN